VKRFVFDTSAILAILLDEPGADVALEAIQNSLMTTVNLTEVLTRCLDKQLSIEATEEFMASHGVQFVEFGYDLARSAAALRMATRQFGLSLGDRACLALAIREQATVMTTDRAWASLDLPCDIELIR